MKFYVMIPCQATVTFEVEAVDESDAKKRALFDLEHNGSKYAMGVSVREHDPYHVEVET